MFAFLPKLSCKFFPHIVHYLARCREARYTEREARRRRTRYARPTLEGMEERIVPDAYVWTGAVSNSWTDGRNWTDTTPIPNTTGIVPGSMDTGTIPAGSPVCVLNSTVEQTIAGLTVTGVLDVNSKLSVTTVSSPGEFDIGTNGVLDVQASADFGGGGIISGQIDVKAATVTFDPGSGMTLAAGASLIGGGQVTINGGVTCNAALSPEVNITLNNNGNTTAGSLTGAGSLTEADEFDWNGGILGLDLGITFEPESDLKLQGADGKELSKGTLTDECNASTLGGTGGLTIDSSAVFDNFGNPSTDVTLPSISGIGTFINDANGFLNIKAPESTPTMIYCDFTNIGTLEVADGTTLTLVNMMNGNFNLDGTLALGGDLILQGAISSPSGLIVNAGLGHLKVGDVSIPGSLDLAQGANVFGTLEVTSDGTLTGAGELYSNGTVELDLGSAASIGSYQQGSSGVLELHAASTGMFGGTSSVLHVAGNAQLSGILKLDLDGGYVPAPGDAFTVLTAGSIGAHFDTTPPDMTVSYGPNGVGLTQN